MRPRSHDLRDLFCTDLTLRRGAAILPGFALGLHVGTNGALFIANLCCALKVLMRDGLFLFLVELLNLGFQLLHVRRRGVGTNAHAGGSFVDQVNGLIRQVAVGDVAVGKLYGSFNRFVRDADLMVRFVTVAQALEDGDGFFLARFAHLHGLETAFQRRVLFDVLAVFVNRRRADALNFAARQRGLEDVRRVDRTFGSACTDQRVQLVDEEDDAAVALELIHHILHALFKFAAVFCTCQHPGQVERYDALAAQQLRHIALRDLLRQAFGNGALAHTRLADEHGVVLGAAGENLDDALDFLAAADHGIEFPGTRGGSQIAAVLHQRRRALLTGGRIGAAGGASLLRRIARLLSAALERLRRSGHHALVKLLRVHADVAQNAVGHALALEQQRQ